MTGQKERGRLSGIVRKLPGNLAVAEGIIALAATPALAEAPAKVENILASGPSKVTSMASAEDVPACSNGLALNVVAHEDDDLLFQNPNIVRDIKNGGCEVTVFMTAGDANKGTSYWKSREQGSKAAYAEMSEVANSWNVSNTESAGHRLPVFKLTGNPKIKLIFMRLPDGNVNGSGFSNNSNESLQKLWQNNIPTIHPADGTQSYTKEGIKYTLQGLMNKYHPTKIRTQDYVDSYGTGDHSDHITTANFTKSAQDTYTLPHTFEGYYDYTISLRPQNVFGSDAIEKQRAFFAYAPYDSVCQTFQACQPTVYGPWLTRQYKI